MGSSLFSFKKWNLNAIQIDDNNDDLPSYTSPPSHPPQKREKSLFCGGWEGEIAFAMAFGDGTKCTVSLTLKIPCFFTTSLRRFHNNKIAEKCGDLPNLPQHPPPPLTFAQNLIIPYITLHYKLLQWHLGMGPSEKHVLGVLE